MGLNLGDYLKAIYKKRVTWEDFFIVKAELMSHRDLLALYAGKITELERRVAELEREIYYLKEQLREKERDGHG